MADIRKNLGEDSITLPSTSAPSDTTNKLYNDGGTITFDGAALGSGSGDVTKVGTPVDNQVGVWTGDGTIEGTADFQWDTASDTLTIGDGTVVTPGITMNGSATGIPVIRFQQLGSNQVIVQYVDGFSEFRINTTGADDISFWTNGTEQVYISGAAANEGNLNLVTGDLQFSERSDHNVSAPAASQGYLWVRDDTPNVLVFTDDTGTDTVLGAGGGGGGDEISDVDGDTRIRVEAAADEDIIRFDTGDSIAGFPAQANTAILSSAQFTIGLPAATGATTGGPVSLTGGTGGPTGDGGNATLAAGSGGATSGNGGDVSITSGAGPTSGTGGDISLTAGAGNSGDGGAVNITAGASSYTGGDSFGGAISLVAGNSAAGADNAYGGAINLTGGSATGTSGDGGTIALTAGAGGYSPGQVTITGGAVGTGQGDAGDVVITGGTGDGNNYYGGDITITGGANDYAAATAYGGSVNIYSGGAGTGYAGSVYIVGGVGGDTSGSVYITGGSGSGGGVPGSVNLTGGGSSGSANDAGDVIINGGIATGANRGGDASINGGDGGPTGGQGGSATMIAGDGGSTSGDGQGGLVQLRAGDGGPTNGAGGDITLTPGAGSGTGTDGAVIISQSSAAPTTPANKFYNLTGDIYWGGNLLSTIHSESFVNGDLAGGVLTVTHSLGRQYVHVSVYDNNNELIQPDTVTATSTSATAIDLTSFGTLTGTWNVVIS